MDSNVTALSLVDRGDRDSAAYFAGASSGNDSDGEWQAATASVGAATAVAERADRAAVAGQVGMVSMMSMDEEEQSAEAKQCLKALKEGKRCRSAGTAVGSLTSFCSVTVYHLWICSNVILCRCHLDLSSSCCTTLSAAPHMPLLAMLGNSF